jgi:hypothetical protein
LPDPWAVGFSMVVMGSPREGLNYREGFIRDIEV